MKKTLVELMKINNVVNKEYENFFLEHIDEFLDNNENFMILMQFSRGFGDVKGRRPDFTSYYKDLEEFTFEHNIILKYGQESVINTFWDYITNDENTRVYKYDDELWTEINVNINSFLFFNKRGIKLMLVTPEMYEKILKATGEKQINWFNANYEIL